MLRSKAADARSAQNARIEPHLRLERSIFAMMISLKHLNRRAGAVLVSLLLLLTLAVSASAAAVKMSVGVRFWRETGDKESMADSAVDTAREATLTRQPNGTFTLELLPQKS